MRKTLSKLISSSSASSNDAVPDNIGSNTNRHSLKSTSLVPNKLSRTSNMFLQSLNSVIDDFYIVLDSPHKIYRAGLDLMCGLVVLIVKKPLNNIYISLSMNGVVKVNDVGLRRSEKARLFSISVNLYGSPNENNGLSKGEHRFPFKIKLPRKNIYSSLSFEKGSISYSLKSELFLSQELSSVNSILNQNNNIVNNNDITTSSSSLNSSNISAVKNNNKFKNVKIPEKNNRLAKCEKNVKIICPINVERFINNKPSVLIIKQPPKKFATNSSTNVSFLSKKSSNSSSNNISSNNIANHSYSNSTNSNTLSSPQLTNNTDNNNDDSFTMASSSSTNNSLTRTISSSIDSNHSLDHHNQQSSSSAKIILSPHLPEKKIKLTLDSPNVAYLPNDVIPFTVKLQHVNSIKSLDGMIITLIRVCKINSYEKQKKSKLRSFSTSSLNNNINNMASSNSFSSIPGIGSLHQKFKDSSVISDSSVEEEEEVDSINEEMQNGDSISAVPLTIPQSIPQSLHESPLCSIRGKIATFRKDIDQVIKPLYVLSANHYTFEVSGNLKLPYDAFPTLRGAPLFSFEYFIEVVVNLNNSHQSLIGSSSSNLSTSPIIDSDDLGNISKRRDKVFNIKRFGSNSSSNGNGSASNNLKKELEGVSYKDDGFFANGKSGSFDARQIVNVDKLKTQKNVISLTRRIIVGTERTSLAVKTLSRNDTENPEVNVSDNTQEEAISVPIEISNVEEHLSTPIHANITNELLPVHPPPFANHELLALPPPIEELYSTVGMNEDANSFSLPQLPPPPPVIPPSTIGIHALNFSVPTISSLGQSNNQLSEKEVLRLQEEALLPSEAPPIFASSSSPSAAMADNRKDIDNDNNTAESSSNEFISSTVGLESAANGTTSVSSLSNDLAALVHSEVTDCVPKYENNE